ncbi:hypothetical protein MKW98_024466 [Papaver atlanticum]|uniref:Uncharacterized protein n=1 Tax=Papaver atlanticum TaxID=357466 RepID=A0AAD4T666_9MAGN|nr:hypothetical protein MKW98_024466 [Papaver atlanticum]
MNLVFVVGAMSRGIINNDYTDDLISGKLSRSVDVIRYMALAYNLKMVLIILLNGFLRKSVVNLVIMI